MKRKIWSPYGDDASKGDHRLVSKYVIFPKLVFFSNAITVAFVTLMTSVPSYSGSNWYADTANILRRRIFRHTESNAAILLLNILQWHVGSSFGSKRLEGGKDLLFSLTKIYGYLQTCCYVPPRSKERWCGLTLLGKAWELESFSIRLRAENSSMEYWSPLLEMIHLQFSWHELYLSSMKIGQFLYRWKVSLLPLVA